MTEATGALERLREGNRRFVGESGDRRVVVDRERRERATADPAPFAAVLGCADARVPAEIVFDQGLGDLFVVRVAGVTVGPSQLGSLEFAVDRLGIPLVVVLGHSGCGAVQATLDALTGSVPGATDGHFGTIVERIRPALDGLPVDGWPSEPEPLLSRAVRRNVRASAGRLRTGSAVLARAIREHGLAVVGAEYSMATGVVDFFDGAPTA